MWKRIIVSSSKEDGASADAWSEVVDEDAPNIKDNVTTIGGMDGKNVAEFINSSPSMYTTSDGCIKTPTASSRQY